MTLRIQNKKEKHICHTPSLHLSLKWLRSQKELKACNTFRDSHWQYSDPPVIIGDETPQLGKPIEVLQKVPLVISKIIIPLNISIYMIYVCISASQGTSILGDNDCVLNW